MKHAIIDRISNVLFKFKNNFLHNGEVLIDVRQILELD